MLGTSSSESVLPQLMKKLEHLGVPRPVVGLTVPTGYSFNLDGTCLYLTLAAVYLAQATNTSLSLAQQLGILGVLLLTSKGAAGVTGSGFIVLAATLSTVGTIPVASIMLIFSTSSSEAALPRLIAKMEHLGVSKPVVGVTVPTGYSFNLDGTAIYLTMASLFVAEALGKPLALGEQISLLVFMIIASKGAAGVTGAGLATLAGGLQSHRPDLVDGVGLIVGIDRFMSEARALTNFTGNAVATVLIGTWTREIDRGRVDEVLEGRQPFDEATMSTDHRFENDDDVEDGAAARTEAAVRGPSSH